jgi:hypothetical protein
MAAAIRIVVPEFDASTEMSAFSNLSIPITFRLLSDSWIWEPKLLQISIVALVSLERNGFLTMLVPLANDAKKIARCV